MASNTLKPTKIQTALIALLAAQSAQAITLQPVQVLSSPDELLYAEIRFSQAETLDGMKVSVATPEDLASLGIHEKLDSENLNFYARSNSHGDGVITITSDKPITASELNVVIKIEQGNATRLQHVRTPLQSGLTASQIKNEERMLTPLMVSEQDISLNLPESSVISMPATNTETDSTKKVGANVASKSEVAGNTSTVVVDNTNNANTGNNTTNTPASNTTATESAQSKPLSAKEAKAQAKAEAAKKQQEAKAAAKAAKASKQDAKNKQQSIPVEKAQVLTIQRTLRDENGQVINVQGDMPLAAQGNTPPPMGASTAKATNSEQASTGEKTQYVVQSNQTLWKIANNIATQTKQPVKEVMDEIHKQNPDAFVNGKKSRLREGATLNLAVAPTFATVSTNDKPQTASSKAKTGKTQSSAQRKPVSRAKQQARAQAKKQRITQAQLSLVAESQQDSPHGTAKTGEGNANSATLNKKVMQAREKVVNTQKNVTSLEKALKGKDQQVQILNARLAALEQQLKDQQASAVKK